MKQVFSFLFAALFLTALLYFGLKMLEIQIGTLIDWAVGICSVMWLIVVLTVPWNSHFRAKEVLDDAQISKRKDILVVEESLNYVRKIARNSLIVAVALHIFTAVLLYWVAASGISEVGYFSAGAAVLLTFLRPAMSYYEYLQQHLYNIRQEFRYPREDLRELLSKTEQIKYDISQLQDALSTEADKDSWRKQVDKEQAQLKAECEKLLAKLEKWVQQNEHAHQNMDNKIEATTQKIRNEIQIQVDKITSDSQVLDSIRTLADFVRRLR